MPSANLTTVPTSLDIGTFTDPYGTAQVHINGAHVANVWTIGAAIELVNSRIPACPKCGGDCGDDLRWPCTINGVITDGCCQWCWEAECAEAWWDAQPSIAIIDAAINAADPENGPQEDEGEGDEAPFSPTGLVASLAAHVRRSVRDLHPALGETVRVHPCGTTGVLLAVDAHGPIVVSGTDRHALVWGHVERLEVVW